MSLDIFRQIVKDNLKYYREAEEAKQKATEEAAKHHAESKKIKMNEKYRKKFLDNYPRIYDKNFYFECDEGWGDLLLDLSNKIQKHCDESGCKQVKALQVKEKFATLRFYISGGDDYISKLIDEAEAKSADICEVTGGYGILHRKGYYYKTVCRETGILMQFKEVKSKKLFQE